MRYKWMLTLAVCLLCIGSMVCSAQVAAGETQATRDLLVEMQRMNPRVPQLREAIANGADVNARSNREHWNGFPVLHIAASSSWKAMVLLVNKGANLNAQDRNGDTAMAIAAESGRAETVLFLLDKGANPDIRNVNGRSVLGKARYTMARPALPRSNKRSIQNVIDILKSRGAKD